MNKLYPVEYPEYQTSLFVVCKPDHSENTLKDICRSEKFSNNIKVYINTRFGNIIFLTAYPVTDKKKNFEKTKRELIESLNNVCSYISIAYDNQTIRYMREISESVYILEREFRTLIEIIFLKEIGVNWYSEYFQNKENEKDRTNKRDKVLQYLNNPLDSLDFVHLKNFVEERIKFSKNIMSDKLDTIKDKLASFESSGDDNTQQLYEKILDNLEEVKKLSGLKKTLEVSNLYQHITSELADEWTNLYDYRNPWAHNHCLMTRSELEKYKELAASVLKKIRTEITLLSLLEDRIEFRIQSDNVVLTLTNFSRLGTPFCRLKLQIKSASQQHILEIIEATYVEVITVLDDLKKYSGYEDYEINLEYLKLNPFLIESIKTFGENLFSSNELKQKIITDLDDLERFMKENSGHQLKRLEGTKSFMKEDWS